MKGNKSKAQKSTRCDQCVKIHRKCSRTLPKCEKCISRDIECTYGLRSRVAKNSTVFEDNLTHFKSSVEHKKERKKRKEEKREGFEFKLIYFDKELEKKNTILATLRKFPKKEILENLMTILQFTSTLELNDGLLLLLAWTKKLDLYARKRQSITIPKASKNFISIDKISVLKEAYETYFKFNNNILPLFVEEDINFESKSAILRIAILASGLKWLELTESTKAILKTLELKIYSYLKIPYRIQPTLENLQIILIVITGLFSFQWVVNLRESLLLQAYRISNIIGYHLYPNKSNKKEKYERALAYSALVYLNLTFNLASGSYVPTPFKHLGLLKMFDRLIKCITAPISSSQKSFMSLKFSCNIILSSFYNDISITLFLLRMLKNKCQYNKEEISSNLTEDLLSKSKLVTDKYLKIYNTLILKYSSSEDILYVERFKNHIYFIYHYYNYFIRSLYFYNSSYCSTTLITLLNSESDIIHFTLTECQLVVKYAILLPYCNMLTFGAAHVSQCLLFIIRYGNRVGFDFNSVLDKGMDYFKELSNLPHYALTTKLNMKLLQITLDTVKK